MFETMLLIAVVALSIANGLLVMLAKEMWHERAFYKVEEIRWRDQLIMAREARDRADLEVERLRSQEPPGDDTRT